MILFIVLYNLESCKKESVEESNLNNTVDASNWSLEKRVSYTREHFMNIGKIINKIWQNNDAKSIIVNKLNKKVSAKHSEASILISEIYDMIEKNKRNLNMSQKLENELLNEIEAFKGIDNGNDVLPQIYFPFYNTSKGRVMKSSDSVNPVFVMAIDPSEPNELPAYEVDSSGNLVEQSYTINEDDARNMDNLIVLSVNEDIQDSESGSDNSNDTSQWNWHKLVLRMLSLDRHHESWAKGDSEVTFKAVAIRYGNNYDPQNPNDYNFTIHDILSTRRNYSGCYIRTFTRDEIDNMTNITVNQVYTNMFIQFASSSPPQLNDVFYPGQYDFNNFNDAVFVILYEYDGWPCAPSNGYIVEPLAYDNYNLEKIKYLGDSRLTYRTCGDGIFGVYWIMNASMAPLNINYTDENFRVMDGIHAIDHDCASIYQP